ncbi:MAG: hypothetical protein ABR577_05925 [Pyrinomonadaceae bacterium]
MENRLHGTVGNLNQALLENQLLQVVTIETRALASKFIRRRPLNRRRAGLFES